MYYNSSSYAAELVLLTRDWTCKNTPYGFPLKWFIHNIQQQFKDLKSMQKNLKLVSARIDPDALEKIEKFIVHHPYWTKNAVINGIITAVMTKFDDSDIYDMVRTNSFLQEDITAIYRINRVQVTQKDSKTQ